VRRLVVLDKRFIAIALNTIVQGLDWRQRRFERGQFNFSKSVGEVSHHRASELEWTGLAQDAARKESSYADFLEQLLPIENGARLERQRDTLMKLATLPSVKTLEQYDFGFASGAPRAQIQELASLTFIERAENVVFL